MEPFNILILLVSLFNKLKHHIRGLTCRAPYQFSDLAKKTHFADLDCDIIARGIVVKVFDGLCIAMYFLNGLHFEMVFHSLDTSER